MLQKASKCAGCGCRTRCILSPRSTGEIPAALRAVLPDIATPEVSLDVALRRDADTYADNRIPAIYARAADSIRRGIVDDVAEDGRHDIVRALRAGGDAVLEMQGFDPFFDRLKSPARRLASCTCIVSNLSATRLEWGCHCPRQRCMRLHQSALAHCRGERNIFRFGRETC